MHAWWGVEGVGRVGGGGRWVCGGVCGGEGVGERGGGGNSGRGRGQSEIIEGLH